MVAALRIDPDGTVADNDLPDEHGPRLEALRSQLRGEPERAVYHAQAAFHLNSDGQRLGLPPNITAWALACAWRGLTLDYPLLGPVIVTGEDHGVAVALPAALDVHVRQAAATVTSVLGEFQRRGAPPGESERVIEEMLTLVRHVTS